MHMPADAWNRKHPPGQPVILTLANGKRVRTQTTGPAFHVGEFDMVPVAAITQGAVPLGWCWVVKAR